MSLDLFILLTVIMSIIWRLAFRKLKTMRKKKSRLHPTSPPMAAGKGIVFVNEFIFAICFLRVDVIEYKHRE